MARKRKHTTDAVKILHDRFIKGDPKRLAAIQEKREKADIAQQIYDLRTQAGLTQIQLAKMIGTTQSVISRLEDADYTGHSLEILQRIAAALHCHVNVTIIPNNAAYG